MKNRFTSAAIAALLSTSVLFSPLALAGLDKKKETDLGLYVTASEAYQMITAHPKDVLFIDIRTRAEVAFLGMPTIADANIPYMVSNGWEDWDVEKKTFKLSPNSAFLTDIEQQLAKKGLNKESKIFVMCRSGHRSAKAVNLLAKAGYKNVYSVVDGYEGDSAKEGEMKGQRVVNGWKNDHLPWSYKLDKEKMYWRM